MKLSCLLAVSTAASAFGTSAAVKAAEGGCFNWNEKDTYLFHPKDWTYCQAINDDMYMYYTPMRNNVMVGLHILEDSYGWSSLGPGGNGGMKGASQIVVRKNNDGKWVAEDRYSSDYATPTLDDQQDVQLLFAQQDDETGETAWGVVIPQNSCDERDYPLEDHDMFMIYAMGSTHDFSFHGDARGSFTANLMGLPPSLPDMSEYDHVDLVMPNVEVVRGEDDLDPSNAFICSYFDMEVLGQEAGFTSSDDKVHLVGYEPVISEGNGKYLHHFTLFSCEGYADGGGLQQRQQGFDDSDLYHQKVLPSCTKMPPGCQSFLGGWAVGSDGVTFPHNVGMPIGEGKRWLVLQTHYYNPSMDEGVYDSSGLRAYLTTDLRPIDAGIMSFAAGVRTGQHPPLPGGLKDIAMETLYVEPECTSQWTSPLNVITVQHHSHYLGSHQEIVVERDGVNLGAMRTEHIFDYNHQNGVEPNSAVRQLLPGDRLAATCHFDTSSVDANSSVAIGEESNKEMCLPSFLYYPKQDVQIYAYLPPAAYAKNFITDLDWCSQPSSNDDFESQCAEKLYTDASGFSVILTSILTEHNGPSFDLEGLCNGGALGSKLLSAGLGICPDSGCTETQTCTKEELKEWAKGVCALNCAKFGLTLYPDLTRTEPYNTANIACPTTVFDAPTLAEPDACEVKGSLPQKIQLTNAAEVVDLDDQFNSGTSLILSSFAVELFMFGSILFV